MLWMCMEGAMEGGKSDGKREREWERACTGREENTVHWIHGGTERGGRREEEEMGARGGEL